MIYKKIIEKKKVKIYWKILKSKQKLNNEDYGLFIVDVNDIDKTLNKK